jgi:UDP-2,3-diacylglucosamine pyrophosphatase LpxH
MSKVAILGDLHFGISNDSPFFLNNSLTYFEEVFFPYLKQNNIRSVIQLGDVFDRRKYVNLKTLNVVRERFLKYFYEENFKLYTLLGNHDVYYKNTNNINSLVQLLDKDKIFVSTKPCVVNIEGYDYGLVPWITEDNEKECKKFIREKKCNYLCGHFEIKGFHLIRGVMNEEGQDFSEFNGYHKVFSGHFHCKQSAENIEYVGTPYQMIFSDMHEKKGFHIFDPSTNSLEFVESQRSLFQQINYNDKQSSMLEMDFSQYENSFVRVNVKLKEDPYTFERFMDSLNSAGTAGITVIEESMYELSQEELNEKGQDTLTLINNEIEVMQNIKNKNKLKKIIHDLYIESFSV